MAQHINKEDIVAEVMKDPYRRRVQYDSIEAGIQAHAEIYSFNIESELFNQLTKEQQGLWRKEIEQACISGGDVGVELARDPRYKENLEAKEINTWHLQKNEDIYDAVNDWSLHSFVCLMNDGSVQKFTGIRCECADGSINTHIDALDDNYDDVDDIIFWIETPNLN